MSITSIQLCSKSAQVHDQNSILLSIVDAEKANCSLSCGDDMPALIRIEITHALDVTYVLGDLLSSFDFDSIEYTLHVRSESTLISSNDVGFLLTALYPGVPVLSPESRNVLGFILHTREIIEDTAHA